MEPRLTRSAARARSRRDAWRWCWRWPRWRVRRWPRRRIGERAAPCGCASRARSPTRASKAATATVVTYTGTSATKRSRSPSRHSKPPIDCFYVYPTVTEQEGPNANLDDRTAGDADRDRPGLALLAGLQGLRADVPAADAEGDQQASITPEDAAEGLHRRARRVQRIHAQVQQGPGHRPDRALPGRADAREADQSRSSTRTRRCASSSSRRSCSAATCSCPKGKLEGGTFQNVPACHGRDRHGLRDRLLDVPERTARRLVLRTARQPAARAGRRGRRACRCCA